MTRDRLARVAMRAYPQRVRAARGQEMLGTLLDASGPSDAAFTRELLGLLGGGVRARVTAPPVRTGAGRLIADGVCYGAIWMIAVMFASRVGLSVSIGVTLGGARGLSEFAVLGGALVAATIGYDRIAAAGALVWLVLVTASPYIVSNEKILLATFALPIICLLVMITKPRRANRRARRAAWLIPIGALGVAAGGVGPTSYLVLAPLALALPVALARLPSDPRIAIAWSLFATEIALAGIGHALEGGPVPIGLPLTILLIALTPLAIAFTLGRARSLQRSNPA
jgi:hypothetical protein